MLTCSAPSSSRECAPPCPSSVVHLLCVGERHWARTREQQGPSTSATPLIIPQRRIPQRRRARRGRNGGAACHSCSNGSHAILVLMGRDRGGFHELNGRIELFGVRSVRCCGLGSRAEISFSRILLRLARGLRGSVAALRAIRSTHTRSRHVWY